MPPLDITQLGQTSLRTINALNLVSGFNASSVAQPLNVTGKDVLNFQAGDSKSLALNLGGITTFKPYNTTNSLLVNTTDNTSAGTARVTTSAGKLTLTAFDNNVEVGTTDVGEVSVLNALKVKSLIHSANDQHMVIQADALDGIDLKQIHLQPSHTAAYLAIKETASNTDTIQICSSVGTLKISSADGAIDIGTAGSKLNVLGDLDVAGTMVGNVQGNVEGDLTAALSDINLTLSALPHSSDPSLHGSVEIKPGGTGTFLKVSENDPVNGDDTIKLTTSAGDISLTSATHNVFVGTQNQGTVSLMGNDVVLRKGILSGPDDADFLIRTTAAGKALCLQPSGTLNRLCVTNSADKIGITTTGAFGLNIDSSNGAIDIGREDKLTTMKGDVTINGTLTVSEQVIQSVNVTELNLADKLINLSVTADADGGTTNDTTETNADSSGLCVRATSAIKIVGDPNYDAAYEDDKCLVWKANSGSHVSGDATSVWEMVGGHFQLTRNIAGNVHKVPSTDALSGVSTKVSYQFRIDDNEDISLVKIGGASADNTALAAGAGASVITWGLEHAA